MKWFALVFVPAFEVLILTLGKIWGAFGNAITVW